MRGQKREKNSLNHGPTQPNIFRLFTIVINSVIVNHLQPIGMIKLQCVNVFPKIFECVYLDMKNDHNPSEHLRTLREYSGVMWRI